MSLQPCTYLDAYVFDDKLGRGRGRLSGMSSKYHQAFNGNSRIPGEGGGSTVGTLEIEGPTAGAGKAGVSKLGLECYPNEEDGREEEDEQLGSKKKKLKKQRDVMKTAGDGGASLLLTEGKMLAFLGAYITEWRERESQRDARDREKETEREEKELLRDAAEREREESRQERERIREEQERRRKREREEREWEREAVNRERWEEERQRERAWEEKRDKEKQEWKERMTTLQLGHQASMAQMQAQIMQSQQNVISLLLGVFLHGSSVEETPGQRRSSALQTLHDLLQHHAVGGAFQSGERKGGTEDSTTPFVIDGEVNKKGT